MLFHRSNKDVNDFAQKEGFKGAEYIGNWKNYKVYEPYMDNNQVAYIGLPTVILVNEKNEIKWSTPEEAMATINDK